MFVTVVIVVSRVAVSRLRTRLRRWWWGCSVLRPGGSWWLRLGDWDSAPGLLTGGSRVAGRRCEVFLR